MKQFDIYLADLNPGAGTEAGKIRPVFGYTDKPIVKNWPSIYIDMSIDNKFKTGCLPLRVRINKSETDILLDSDILIDQIRAIDNKRFVRYLATIPEETQMRVKESLGYILDLVE